MPAEKPVLSRYRDRMDKAIAALGIVQSANGASLLRFITAGPGIVTATITTQAATGSIRIALGASISA